MERALLLSEVDKEDYWVNGFAFVVPENKHYKDDFSDIKGILCSQEFIKELVSKFSLEERIFNGNKLFKFSGVRYDYKIIFTFINQNGDTVDFSLSLDHIDIIDKYKPLLKE